MQEFSWKTRNDAPWTGYPEVVCRQREFKEQGEEHPLLQSERKRSAVAQFFRKNPEKGPKILFFSGGTALKDISRELIKYTFNSIHIVTPFDSGGSSAVLRRAFHMPAVGDIRNRLLALSDTKISENSRISDLFAHRFLNNGSSRELFSELHALASGQHLLIERISEPMRRTVQNHLHRFLEYMPHNFELAGASIGNLVLAAGYLSCRRTFDPVISQFSRLANVSGIVRPVVNEDLHLAAELEDGRSIIGQHLMTGKEVPPLSSPIKRLWLTSEDSFPTPVEPVISPTVRKLILEADCICFPVGSFYTSLISNLLPRGVGRAVATNPCPKIFIPNTAFDPELSGMDLQNQTKFLLQTLQADTHGHQPQGKLLDYLLIDSRHGMYQEPVDFSWCAEQSINVIDCNLIRSQESNYIDEEQIVPVLLSLAV